MRLCGAGVLPFKINHRGQVVFLLGREAFSPGWIGSGKISAFEGGSHTQEDAFDNAVREFVEESLAVLCDKRAPTPESLIGDLRRGDFSVRICVQDAHRNEEHCTFLKRFDWDDDVVQRFKDRRDALLEINECNERLEQLQAFVPRRYPFLRPDDLVLLDAPRCVSDVCASARAATHGVVLELELMLHDVARSEPPIMHRFSYVATDEPEKELCVVYARLLATRRTLSRLVDDTPSVVRGALCETRAASGVLLAATVRNEWLEKACVHEYTVAQLFDEAKHNRRVFRPYFLLVVRQAVAQLVAPAAPFSKVHVSA